MSLRALAFCLLLGAGLAACSSDPEERSPAVAVAAQLRGGAGSGQGYVPRFAARLRAEAPILQVGFVKLNQVGNMVLERRHGDFEYWISSDGLHIVLQSGMLHSTRGLGEELLASELSEPRALILARRSGQADRFHTYLNGNDRAVTRTYRCVIENDGPQETELVTGLVPTTLMTERCRNLDQSFVNFYWVSSESGQIVQARQWAGPRIENISTRIVPN